uniref:Protein C37A2.8, isoform a n=2 Tax=Haemonchus contortus TaxID=6289 RepID=A0A7I5E5H0_HAECO
LGHSMAAIASSSQSIDVADEEPEKAKYEPKKLHTNEVASLFDLKNEYLKKKNNLIRTTPGEIYRGGKSSVLAVKKEEKTSLKKEALERKRRINEYEAALRREEEERLALAAKKLKEKSDLYDKLAEGGISLQTSEGLDVEFLVDFNAKVKERQENKLAASNHPVPQPSSSTMPEQPVQPIEHYAPDEERREYGPSHMKFSSDEEKRQAEIKSLYDMTAETEKMRAKNKALAEQKARARREKINALRKRKGLPEERTPSPEPEPDQTEVMLEEIPLPADDTVKKTEKKPVREWDRGKGSYNTWILRQRDEREEEFAPPSFYYNS